MEDMLILSRFRTDITTIAQGTVPCVNSVTSKLEQNDIDYAISTINNTKNQNIFGR